MSGMLIISPETVLPTELIRAVGLGEVSMRQRSVIFNTDIQTACCVEPVWAEKRLTVFQEHFWKTNCSFI